MKHFALLAACGLLLVAGSVFAQDVAKVNRPANVPSFVGYVPDEFIVVLRSDIGKLNTRPAANGVIETGMSDLDALSHRFAVSNFTKQFPGSNEALVSLTRNLARYYKVKFESGTLDDAMAAYRQHPLIDHVEPIGIHTVYATPNDGFYGDQWHLTQANDHDVDAPEAWDLETGDPAIIVAILDTGVRYYHKDLGGSNASSTNPTAADGNMWINWTEKNGAAGVDDDGNGYVDDWVGYDWVDGATPCWSGEDCNTADNDPRDFNGHGTHCAGNVSAITNNGYATAAVSGGWGNGTLQPTGNGVKTMACRIGWSGTYIIWEVGYVRMDFAASAFYYAANNGARIASCSWGSSNSGGIDAAVTYFINSGGLVFHAAGNDGSQTADYLGGRTDVINVAATDSLDCKADFSTYGTWVDISAPGTGIMSLYHDHSDPASDYVAMMDGTSMATPISASVAGLIWSRHPDWTAAQVRDRLYATADNIYGLGCNSSYAGKLGAGRVNAFNAVNDGPVCDVIANFSATPTSGCAPLVVNFTDLSTGTGIDSWAWTFGDGGTSTAQNPSYTYTTAGTYTVTLTATSSSQGCSDGETKTAYITVSTTPVANFSGSPTSGYAPLTVNFTDLSTGGATSWSWDFGDLGTSTAQNPSHVYASAGTYTVTLTASNACGSDGETKVGYITVSTPPAQQCDDFNDGNLTGWVNALGTWTATGGYMRGNSNTTNARITSPFGSFTTATIDCDVRMNSGRSQRNARIIFAYRDASNYRFVQGDDVGNTWKIYNRAGGSNTQVASWARTITTGVWYHVQVIEAADGTTTLKVDGVTVGTYKFASALAGAVGCGFTKSVSDFDNFCVGASAGAAAFTDEIAAETVARSQDGMMPADFTLDQNYPNPFNPATTIGYSLSVPVHVTLEVYNVIGQRVRTLVDQAQSPGHYEVEWNSTDEAGKPVASGVYFYRLTTDTQTMAKKMLLLK
ncbi:MAG: S8 family serine peptidase [Candidatus Zixiibacteriota bacterium]